MKLDNDNPGRNTMQNHIAYYAESLGNGRGIMRVDVVVDGELVPELSGISGSPAPLETVKRYERTVML